MDGLAELVREVLRAASNPVLREGVRRASANAEAGVERVLTAYPWIAEEAKRHREVRKRVVDSLESLVEEAVASLRRNGFRVHLAEGREDALDYIGRVVGKGKVVVMSKSMTAEELGLREYLEGLGNEVWETDLGQLLVQLSAGKPMHSVAPAVHLTREEAAKLVEGKLGVRLRDRSAGAIVAAVRRFLREKMVRADVGISGANAIAADVGAVVIVENEGNARLVTGLPPVHIVVAGVEKIVPTIFDALRQALVQAAYAGVFPPTYINVVTGPSSTADIEHQRVIGAQGPREAHVVLVDNGRRRASRDPVLRDQLRCVRCGRCQFACPVWNVAANTWGGRAYGGPMGVGWTAITEGRERGRELAMLCLSCGRCNEVCPMGIDLAGIAWRLRAEMVSGLAEGKA